MNIKKLILTVCLFTFSFSVSAHGYLDSLWSVWQDKNKHDSVRLDALYSFIWDGYVDSDPDSTLFFAQIQYDFAKEKGYKNYMQRALSCQGLSYLSKAEYPKAIDYISRALVLSNEISNKKGIAGNLTNLGVCYLTMGNYGKSLGFFLRGLNIHQEIGNKNGILICLDNIGILYMRQGNLDMALKYHQESLNISKEINDLSGSASAYNNMAHIYQQQGNQKKALEYFLLAKKILDDYGILDGVSNILNNIGQCYQDLGEYVIAEKNYKSALEINKKMHFRENEATVSINLGLLNNLKGNWNEAISWCNKGLAISENIEIVPLQKYACECLYNAHKKLKNEGKALYYNEKVLALQVILNKDEAGKKLQQMEYDNQILKDSLKTAEKERLLEEEHQQEVRKKNQTRNILIGVGVLVLLIATGLFGRLRIMRKSKATLQIEKDLSENLLLNILPADIAAELKANGKAEAREFELVSILFTDFKSFTQTSEKLSATELISEINICFEAFDKIVAKYNIEKIKTIGDAYMAAGGLPIANKDSVKNTVLAALEMQHFITKRKEEHDAIDKPSFEMRVGIHSGPIVAGIVGVKKFQYDVWGDTVNTASRMESNGEIGKVNISESTHALLKDDDSFTFINRGEIDAKGKGKIAMYFVEKVDLC